MQADAPAQQPGPGLDLGRLAEMIGQAFQTVLTGWAEQLPAMLLGGMREMVSRLWHAIWSSGFNLLATPFVLTIDFGPARVLGRELATTVYAITVLAIALLALRILWRTLHGGGGSLEDAVNGVLLGTFLAGLSTLLVGQAFLLTGIASDAIGQIDYRPGFEPQTLLTVGPNLLLGLFTLVVMIVYGWRLLCRAAYRVVLLMVLAPFAPVAGILWAIPQTRWISVLYWVMLGGWLAGGILAIGVISLAVQLSTIGNTEGILSLVFGVALVQVAYDLMGVLPKGALGGISVGSPFRMFAGVGFTGGAAMGAVAAAGVGAAAGAATGGGGVAGALPGGGDAPGYGYD